MDISFYKGDECSRQPLQLTANLYNKFRTLLSRSGEGVVFVPIRNIQYLAVIDDEEVMFVDGFVRHMVIMSWDMFQPQVRNSLADSVPCDQVIYDEAKAAGILKCVEREFLKALELMASREKKPDVSRKIAILGAKA